MLDWLRLIPCSNEELGELDVAEINLACAAGLPGSERMDAGRCLHVLDTWTHCVRRYTDLAYEQFFRANPAEFEHSEAYFRVLCMVTALQRHCGVRYDPSKIGLPADAPFDLEDDFVHGIVQGPGGTCATLPVVYAAIG